MDKEEIAKHLAEFFRDEPQKITIWWFTENLNFGGVTPAWLYLQRPKKFEKWLRHAKKLNERIDRNGKE